MSDDAGALVYTIALLSLILLVSYVFLYSIHSRVSKKEPKRLNHNSLFWIGIVCLILFGVAVLIMGVEDSSFPIFMLGIMLIIYSIYGRKSEEGKPIVDKKLLWVIMWIVGTIIYFYLRNRF